MLNLLLTVFAVEVLVRIIDAIGASTINEALWSGINYLPVATSKAAAQQRKLQAEYLAVRRDMNATSSQDEFAKWAKLRRRHDKLLEQLEALKKAQESSKSRFNTVATGLRMVLVRGPQYILPLWYGKEAMFWLPHGWFPYAAEWVLSFPRAPLGSVSIASWQLACSGVVLLLSELLTAVLSLLFTGRAKEAPLKSNGGKAGGEKKAGSSSAEKSTAEDKKTS